MWARISAYSLNRSREYFPCRKALQLPPGAPRLGLINRFGRARTRLVLFLLVALRASNGGRRLLQKLLCGAFALQQVVQPPLQLGNRVVPRLRFFRFDF